MPRKLHVVSLGGTIASARPQSPSGAAGESDPDAVHGVEPRITGEEIAASARLDDLFGSGGLQVSFDQVAQAGGPNVTLAMVADVVESCRRAREVEGAEAAVVTQGTDSLEETAFALSLLNDSGMPIVATGAMRHPELPGADGPANVQSAAVTALALAESGEEWRAVLVINDEIHDPWFVRKAHTTSPGAFTSGPVLGALGWISEGRPVIAHLPARRRTPAWRIVPRAQSVIPIIEAGSGDGLELLDGLTPMSASGIVIAGLGGGHVAEAAATRVTRLAERMPVVIASRTGAGSVLTHTYSWVGGDIHLRDNGLITAGLLDPRKARIVLEFCVANSLEPRCVFERYFQS